eukprot:2355721-Pyramimonas_sp.AAC.2
MDETFALGQPARVGGDRLVQYLLLVKEVGDIRPLGPRSGGIRRPQDDVIARTEDQWQILGGLDLMVATHPDRAEEVEGELKHLPYIRGIIIVSRQTP